MGIFIRDYSRLSVTAIGDKCDSRDSAALVRLPASADDERALHERNVLAIVPPR